MPAISVIFSTYALVACIHTGRGTYDIGIRPTYEWHEDHETGNFNGYSWKHENTSSGQFGIIPDPTGSGKGNVYCGEIISQALNGQKHRLYPTLQQDGCLFGPFHSTFRIWADFPLLESSGWISIATYTCVSNWQDLFGVNFISEDGETRLTIFHVPTLGLGNITRTTQISFPMKQWVQIDIDVDAKGRINLYQDGSLIATALKHFGPKGPAICEAHWGLYAAGEIQTARLLNDDISIISYGTDD